MKKTVFFSILIILLLGLAYIFWFDFKNQFVLIGWDTMFPLNPTANLKYLTTWVDNNNGTVVLSSLHFIILFYLFLSKISHSLTVMQFLHVYIIHVVGALGTYYLAYVLLAKHPKKIMISLLAGIMYLFTPAFLNMYFGYPTIGFVSLALALFVKGMHKKNKSLYALAIAIVISLGNLPDPHPRPLFLILTPLFLYCAIEAILNKNIRRVFFYLFLVLLYVFLFNAWFFLGFISNSLLNSDLIFTAKNIPFIFDNRFRDEGTAAIEKMFRLFHDGLIAPALEAQTYLSNSFMILLHYLRPLLAFSAILFLKHKKRGTAQNIIFLLILSVLFLFLAKSINPPFGILYRLALEYVPPFRVFRTSAYFILEVAIAYCILIPFSILEIAGYVSKWKFKSRLIVIILFVLVMISSYPLLLRYPAYFQPDPIKPATLGTKLPDSYFRLNEFLNSQPQDTKTISIPIDPGYELLNKNPWYFGIPMLPFIIDKPLINQRYQDFGTTTFSLPLTTEKELVEGNNTSHFLLNLSNIRYIVVKNNARYVEEEKTRKNLSKNFRFKKSLGDLDIYEYRDFLLHMYIPSRTIITDKPLESLADIIDEYKIESRGSIYFSLQNSPAKLNTLRTLAIEREKTPTIEYKKINQTKYRVIVHNAIDDFPLIFSESFHNGWKLYQTAMTDEKKIANKDYTSGIIQGTIQNDNLSNGSLFETILKPAQPEDYHLMTNSYANSWVIKPQALCKKLDNCRKNPDQSYDLELVIEYLPQKMTNIGYVISLITVIITCSYFIYARYKQN